VERILIADSSDIFASAVQRGIGPKFETYVSTDGSEVPRLLTELQPVAMILNLSLPRKDGMTILRESGYLPPVILAITNYADAHMERRILAMGVSYILIMPTVNTVVGSLEGLLAQRRETSVVEPEEQTALHLHILHVQTHREGYRQLLAAVPMLIRDPGLRVSKELYPTIARELGYSDGRAVERSIAAASPRPGTCGMKRYGPDTFHRIATDISRAPVTSSLFPASHR